ncbi:MAG: hypothetical protein WB999_10790, partial [Candidatus Binataceae bacterium]
MHIERDRRRRASLRELLRRDNPAEHSGAQPAVLLWCDQTVEAGLLELGVVFIGSGALLIVLGGSRSEIRGKFAGQLLNALQFGVQVEVHLRHPFFEPCEACSFLRVWSPRPELSYHRQHQFAKLFHHFHQTASLGDCRLVCTFIATFARMR